jgi:hypothetical protein
MVTTTKTKSTEAERLFADLDKPSLHALSYALRHPDTWPKGFKWDYQWCTTCAMGLAGQLWNETIGTDSLNVSTMARAFALPWSEAKEIFEVNEKEDAPTKRCGFLWLDETVDWHAVSPEMVAGWIDDYLKRAE